MRRPTVPGITIDGPTSVDLDDAVWADTRPEGVVRILVSIADVAALVPAGSDIDKEARRRLHTVYRPLKNFPMLPGKIEHAASLLQNRERAAVTMQIDLGPDLSVRDVEVFRSTLRSTARLIYAEVPEIARGQGQLAPLLKLLEKVALRLLEQRRQAGALALYDLAQGWITTEEGHLKQVDRNDCTIGYVIVQELMILANKKLAHWCTERDLPVLYRNHTARAAAPDRALLMQQIEAAVHHPLGQLDALRARTNMVLNRADYGPSLLGHYGLNLPAYLHSTSPIRRYADLIVQRQVVSALAGEPPPYSRDQLITMAVEMNGELSLRRERSQRFSEERKDREAARMLPNNYSAMTESQLHRALRQAVAQPEPPPNLREALTARWASSPVQPIEMFLLLVSVPSTAAWLELRKMALQQLVEAPSLAVQTAHICQTVAGWSPVRFEVRGGQPGAGFTVTASITVQKIGFSGGPCTDRNRKRAEQRAVVDLFARRDGLCLQAAASPEAASPVPPPPKAPPLPLPGDNPIAALQEHCQALGRELPAYEDVGVSGPPHNPRFTVRCLALGGTADATAPSKKEAKKAAAANLLLALAQENK